MEKVQDKIAGSIAASDYISRDLSWLKFNYRVLDQARDQDRTLFERLKFMAITSSNLDEFFMIRVGSLYNYIDYGRERIDYSGLREIPFKKKLFEEAQQFFKIQNEYFNNCLAPLMEENGFSIVNKTNLLKESEQNKLEDYFVKTIFPMLTPMVYDSYHTFPLLMNKLLIFGVVSKNHYDKKGGKKLSFVQVPQNLPRFFEIERNDHKLFIPVQEVIRQHIYKLFRNVELISVNLFRITRNGDFTLEESDDIEANFLEEIKRKLKTRKSGRVVRVEAEAGYDEWMMRLLMNRWEIERDNIFKIQSDGLLDLTSLWYITGHHDFKDKIPDQPRSVPPLTYPATGTHDIFDVLKNQDILLHHPYNTMEPVLELIEQSAEDPNILAIKITLYRIARDSRITNALLKAAENGKHVSVLFEVKARFDEENNIREAQRLQQAGCFVIYGITNLKTHTKLLLIVRKEGEKVTRYVHMSSGNYNEDTSKLYTDLGLLSAKEEYAHDISEFFNVITGHSLPSTYQYLITSPKDMRQQLIKKIRKEAHHAKMGLSSGIAIKINSLEDKETIEEFYKASQAGVPIRLIVRGICCLRPGRPGLSENISVKSIVGDYLEHTRLFYFHNNGSPQVFSGSADIMIRSFERRLESLFAIVDDLIKKQAVNILHYNLKDNVNSYILREDGEYKVIEPGKTAPFNIHKEFYNVQLNELDEVKLFG